MRIDNRSRLGGIALSMLIAAALVPTAAQAAKPPAGGGGGSTSTSTVTAQAAFSNFGPSFGTYGYQENESYEFDVAAAQAGAWEAGVLAGTPQLTSCAGGGCKGSAPSAPEAPSAPPVTIAKYDWNSLACTFWAGGKVPDNTESLTVSTTTGAGATKATWTFTYVYTYTGKTVDSQSFWTLTSTTGSEGANVNFHGRVTGLSAMSTASTPLKFSFSLVNTDGSLRASTPVFTIANASGTIGTYTLGMSAVNAKSLSFGEFGIGTTAVPGARGFTNAFNGYHLYNRLFANGDSALIAQMVGDARWLLNNDSFLGNDNGGADGSSLSYINLSPVDVKLVEGTYSYTLSMVIKDAAGTTSQTVSITRSINIIGLGSCPVS